MLLRSAKFLTGLRLLIAEAAPIIASSVGLLSARSAAYLVGFALGSIAIGWLPIIATLISIAGIFGGSTQECDNYRAELERVRLANLAAQTAAIPLIKAWEIQYKAWQIASQNYAKNAPPCKIEIRYESGCGTSYRDVCWGGYYEYCISPPYPPYSVPAPVYPTISYILSPSTYLGKSIRFCISN
jgi:hypothetical protein